MRQDPVSRDIFDAVVDERDCLREEITQLKQVLVSDDDFPWEWKIRPTARRLLRHLLARKTVSKTSAYLALYEGSDGDGPSETILNAHICHLRKRLKPLENHESLAAAIEALLVLDRYAANVEGENA